MPWQLAAQRGELVQLEQPIAVPVILAQLLLRMAHRGVEAHRTQCLLQLRVVELAARVGVEALKGGAHVRRHAHGLGGLGVLAAEREAQLLAQRHRLRRVAVEQLSPQGEHELGELLDVHQTGAAAAVPLQHRCRLVLRDLEARRLQRLLQLRVV